MTEKEIHNSYARIISSLDQGEMKNAFEMLQMFISGTKSYHYQGKLDELQETYQLMLRYYVEGMNDPMQEQIYANICAGAYELTDSIKHDSLHSFSSLQYYATRRNLSVQPTDLHTCIQQIQMAADVEDSSRYEESVDLMFDQIWSTAILSDNDVSDIRIALSSNYFPLSSKCQIVSALLLGLQVSFDREKIFLLFDAARIDDSEVSIRALIAICLVLYVYRRRTSYYPGIRQRLETLGESPDFQRIMTTIMMRFILSRETEKVSHKLQEEILPEMLKLTSQKKGFFIADLSELMDDEMNPEWKDFLSNSSLARKIEEYSELHEEGVDIMHSTFIHLKNFHFFRKISNWFLPFSSNHTELSDKHGIDAATLEMVMQASSMCNSDMYSMYFSLFQLPESQRNAMLNQLSGQLGEMKEQQGAELKSKKSRAEIITGSYIQDLYRFYKLHPRHPEFDDIFNQSLEFHLLPILKPWFSDTETLFHIAELYLRKGYYEAALTVYNELITKDMTDCVLLQKRGYCKQMTGDINGALEDYLRSEMINPDSKWVIRKIAGCYRTLKQSAKSLEYYLHLDKLSPDNTSILINIGHCYLELKQHDEALKYYFKADYLSPNNQKAWRAIAWCSFLTGKYGQAQNYYAKIIENQPYTHDYLNAGHTAYALRDIKKALEYYAEAILCESGDFDKFADLFTRDIPELTVAGIHPTEISLILDWLRYQKN